MFKLQLLLVLSLLGLVEAASKKPCISLWTGTGASLNFGTILQGEEKNLSVRVANRCQTPTAVALAISGTPFQSAELPVSFTLPKHKRTTLQIRFAPTQAGNFQEQLTANFSSQTQSITLKGIALADGSIIPPDEAIENPVIVPDPEDSLYEDISLEELLSNVETPSDSTEIIAPIDESIAAPGSEPLETSTIHVPIAKIPDASTRAQIRYDLHGRIVQGMPGPYQWTSNRR